MSIFAIYSTVELTQAPDWLEGFYKKYAAANRYHVTLKQSCFLEDHQIEDVKHRLSRLFDAFPVPAHEIVLYFRDLVLDDGMDKQKTIMIDAIYESSIHELQRHILAALLPYRDYVHKESQAWEEHFKPHITLAADINQAQYTQALKELGKDFSCVGVIRDVSLIIVEQMSPREADDPKHQTVYRL